MTGWRRPRFGDLRRPVSDLCGRSATAAKRVDLGCRRQPPRGSGDSFKHEDRGVEPRLLEAADEHGLSELNPAMSREGMGGDPENELRPETAIGAVQMDRDRPRQASVVYAHHV